MKKSKTENDVCDLLSGGGKEIPLFKVHMPESVIAPLKTVLLSGYIGQGPRVEEFENKLAERLGNSNVLTLNSGTSAIMLALRLAKVGFGDEVISTPMTCMATNVPILAMGARIVWADINPATGNIDPLDVERKITGKTKAVIGVHWGGYPCDIDELNQIGSKYNIKIIEDAAHAFGASYHTQPIGSLSDFTCFSFQAIKQLTTVDGGALTCRNTEDFRQGKLLRWYGIDREGERRDFRCEEDVKEYGYKFHMNDVSATIGIEQLKYVDDILQKHRENASYYRERFRGLKGLTLLEAKKDRKGSYWLFTLKVHGREEFMQKMKDAGIVVSKVHARNDAHSVFAEFRCNLPGVDKFTSEQVSIPVGWWLSEKEREYIVKTVMKICR
jgi:dTDP-4-amino-4,6-dideoxygalactose transaminase